MRQGKDCEMCNKQRTSEMMLDLFSVYALLVLSLYEGMLLRNSEVSFQRGQISETERTVPYTGHILNTVQF